MCGEATYEALPDVTWSWNAGRGHLRLDRCAVAGTTGHSPRGLLGILIGEQIPSLVRGYLQQKPVVHAWMHQVRPHMFGHLPAGSEPQAAAICKRNKTMGRRGNEIWAIS